MGWWRDFKQAVGRRRSVHRQILQYGALLKPGYYRLGWNMACLPEDIERFDELTPTHQAFLRQNINSRGPRRWAERLPPRVVYNAGSGGTGTASVLLHRGDCSLLLESDGRHVLRLCRDGEMTARLLGNARRLSPGLAIPSIEPFDTGIPGVHGTREGIFEGALFKQLPGERLEGGYRNLLGQCARASAHAEPARLSADRVGEVMSWPLPEWLQSALNRRRDELITILTISPSVYAHGDAHLGNLVLLQDGTVGLIDIERADWLPFFFDALYVLRGPEPASAHLRGRYLDGAFDDELRKVWISAGREFEPSRRLDYLLAVGIAHALRAIYRGKTVPKRAKRLRNVTRGLEDHF